MSGKDYIRESPQQAQDRHLPTMAKPAAHLGIPETWLFSPFFHCQKNKSGTQEKTNLTFPAFVLS